MTETKSSRSTERDSSIDEAQWIDPGSNHAEAASPPSKSQCQPEEPAIPTLPWLKFFPTDWLGSASLRVCSLAAQGLWMIMLCLMHAATPRGTLRINGTPIAEEQLAKLSGSTIREVRRLLKELRTAGVYSIDDEGVIFCRRMVRDSINSARAKANGLKGGNPALKTKRDLDKDRIKGEVIPQTPEARSQKDMSPPTEAPANKGDEARLAVEIYNVAARESGWPEVQRLTTQRQNAVRSRLRECDGLDGWSRAIERAQASPFLCGDSASGWRADFDFLTKGKNFVKLMEGGYDRSKTPHRGGPNPHDAIFEALAKQVEPSGCLAREQAVPDGWTETE